MTPAPSRSSSEPSDEDRRRVGEEIALRLRKNGVHLTGKETSGELADLDQAMEDFERAVERSGGDRMVDEPVSGDAPIAPDENKFVLPSRDASESVAAYIRRIQDAAGRAKPRGRAP